MPEQLGRAEGSFPLDDFYFGGKRVTLAGILRSAEEFHKNKAVYERLVAPYSAVMLEQPPWGVDFTSNLSSFGQLAAIAGKMGKPVYIADPFDGNVLAVDAACCVGGLSMIVKSSMDLAKAAAGKSQNELGRRGFLLRMGALAVGAPLFFGSLLGLDLRSAVDWEAAYDHGLDDELTWGSKDWRDLWIALGILKVISNVQELNALIAFHGLGHQQGIIHYLLHPEARGREAGYLPFKKVSSNLAVREWVRNKDKWELTRQF